MAKSAREKIRLVSSAGTGHFYTTDKNKRNMPEKMEIKKYDPTIRKHVIYKEAKIKQIDFNIARKSPAIRRDFFCPEETGKVRLQPECATEETESN